jgi:uncharacterized protein YecE (DUF72 family)
MLTLDLSPLPDRLRVGTSSFSTADWNGVFYPPAAKPGEYLIHYATQLPTVEIDATFYAIPSPRTVAGWRAKTPDGFVIAAKVPRVITHDQYLVDCDAEWRQYLETMEGLGDRLGPLLFQFPYFAKRRDAHEYATGDDFRRRLEGFLPKLPRDRRFVVEIRNEKWLTPALTELLGGHGVSLALVHFFTMPTPQHTLDILQSLGTELPGDFTYIRFLGHHREMDKLVARAMKKGDRKREWESLIVDRDREVASTVTEMRRAIDGGRDVFAYFNNHYAGFAPGSIDRLVKLWQESEGQTSVDR